MELNLVQNWKLPVARFNYNFFLYIKFQIAYNRIALHGLLTGGYGPGRFQLHEFDSVEFLPKGLCRRNYTLYTRMK
jgi:hypothetical protein